MALVIVDGKARVRLTLDEGRKSVGRDAACDWVVDDPSVSRRHLSFEWIGARWYVRDEGSRNGTELDGLRLQANVAVRIAAGMRLRMGHLDLQIADAGASEAERAEPDTVLTEFAPEQFLPREEEETVIGRSFDRVASEVIYRAQAALFPGQALETMLESLLHLLLGYVPANRAVVQLVDAEGVRPQTALALDTASEHAIHDALLSERLRDRVINNKRSVLVQDAAQDQDSQVRRLATAGVTSAVCAPIFDGNDILGLLYVELRRAGHQLGEGDVAIVSLLASLAGPMLSAQQMVSALMQSEAALREENRLLREQLSNESR